MDGKKRQKDTINVDKPKEKSQSDFLQYLARQSKRKTSVMNHLIQRSQGELSKVLVLKNGNQRR